MKRNNLTTAVVAGIAGVAGFAGLANAVDLNPDGLGQVLIYPYYTVNADQVTALSVVNSSDVGKVVKVRFLEGYNSREVLDFNVYLSANDVWTAAVTAAGDETTGAQIATTDHSCVDNFTTSPQPFLPYAYNGALASLGQPADSGPQDITRTREGYFEIIAMGDIITGSALDADITHVQDGTPDGGLPTDCSFTTLETDVVGSIVAPTSGLFGHAYISNVAEGTYYGYNAEALDGFTSQALYSAPSSLLPSLQQANDTVATNGSARAFVFEAGGALLAADYVNGVDAVSATLMADTLYNEYYVDPAFGSTSDWVVTFPTKRFYVDQLVYPAATLAPFEFAFDGGVSNVAVTPSVYDREEGSQPILGQSCPSPIDPATCLASSPILPYEVNVISFTTTSGSTQSSVLGSALFKELAPYGVDGWARLDLIGPNVHQLPGGVTPAGDSVSLNGLPAVGFFATNVINANATPGVLSNYSAAYRHRASRSCIDTTAAGGTAGCS